MWEGAKVIDIHSHVLPFVDDGSRSMEESLKMLSELRNQGVKHVILTPHKRYDFNISREEIAERFLVFKKEVESQGIDIKLYLGREIYISPEKGLDFLQECLTLNDTKYLLIEFRFVQDDDVDVVDISYELVRNGYIPIISHIERYPYLTEYNVEEIRAVGAKIQVNAESIVSGKAKRFRKKVRNLLKRRLVDFVASDIHFGRENCIQKAYNYVAKKISKEYADQVFTLNAQDIIGEKTV